jgi:hypothetical protein
MILRGDHCDVCISHCAGEPVRCQQAAADWLITTITSFGGCLATAHTVAGLWLSDPLVSPVDLPHKRSYK